MRLSCDSPYHLTYCTNIHPGEHWQSVFTNLQTYIPQLKQKVSPNQPFGIGLRLANIASEELLSGNALAEFQDWLTAQHCYVFTLNGFPYGGFHHQVVKEQVYAPDWSQTERFHYTQRLVTILGTLLPESLDGGISTVPLSYKPWWQPYPEQLSVIFKSSVHHLAAIAAEMAKVEATTGKLLHLDLEPEPDALLENADEVIAFYQDWLLTVGVKYLQREWGVNFPTAERWLKRHIRVCYDTCHFAVAYEEPATTFAKFQQAGIAIGKFQLSAAIRIPIPRELSQRQALYHSLEPFAESTYLHQVIEQQANRSLNHYSDLGDALTTLNTTTATEWRTHFHVPIFIDRYPPFFSTQDHIADILKQLPQVPDCSHLEIETYTWEVLPSDLKLDLLSSIQREYEWVLATLPQSLVMTH